MDRPNLEIHPEAVEEARAAREWYEARSPAAAESFVEELDDAMERIAGAPESWGYYLHGARACLLHRFPYIVVYRQFEESIQVVAIAHGRRRPGYWKDRSQE